MSANQPIELLSLFANKTLVATAQRRLQLRNAAIELCQRAFSKNIGAITAHFFGMPQQQTTVFNFARFKHAARKLLDDRRMQAVMLDCVDCNPARAISLRSHLGLQ